MDINESNKLLHQRIVEGELWDYRISYDYKIDLYEINLGERSILTSLYGVKQYLDFLDNMLEKELIIINDEYFGYY